MGMLHLMCRSHVERLSPQLNDLFTDNHRKQSACTVGLLVHTKLQQCLAWVVVKSVNGRLG